MEKVYPILGKIFLALLALTIVAGGGAYLNQKGYFNTKILDSASPSPLAEVEYTQQNQYNLEVINTPQAIVQTKVITAGLDKSSGLSFSKYQMIVASGWTDNRVTENEGVPVDTLTLAKGEYNIKIFQAATGGALCMYPNDAVFEGPSSKYDNFVNLTTTDGTQIRRSGTTTYQGNSRGFTVCQKSTQDASYQQPTGYGHISITTPVNFDVATMTEIDGMLTSLQKI
jgi:hypothetical protein